MTRSWAKESRWFMGAGKGEDRFFLLLSEKAPSCWLFDLFPKRPISDSDLQNRKVMNLCCFRLLRLWPFVPATGSSQPSGNLVTQPGVWNCSAPKKAEFRQPWGPRKSFAPAPTPDTLWRQDLGPWEDLSFPDCDCFKIATRVIWSNQLTFLVT